MWIIKSIVYKEIDFNKSSVPGKLSTISIKNLEIWKSIMDYAHTRSRKSVWESEINPQSLFFWI